MNAYGFVKRGESRKSRRFRYNNSEIGGILQNLYAFLVFLSVLACKPNDEVSRRNPVVATQTVTERNCETSRSQAALQVGLISCNLSLDFRCNLYQTTRPLDEVAEGEICFLSPEGQVCIPTLQMTASNGKAQEAECYHINLPLSVKERISGKGVNVAAAMAVAHGNCLDLRERVGQ